MSLSETTTEFPPFDIEDCRKLMSRAFYVYAERGIMVRARRSVKKVQDLSGWIFFYALFALLLTGSALAVEHETAADAYCMFTWGANTEVHELCAKHQRLAEARYRDRVAHAMNGGDVIYQSAGMARLGATESISEKL